MSFPKELTALRQWICWRLEPDPKSDKPRKVPYDPKTGRKASSTNPESWATLAEAQAAREMAITRTSSSAMSFFISIFSLKFILVCKAQNHYTRFFSEINDHLCCFAVFL